MTQEEVLAEFRAAGALLEGHFILSSGLHSPRYLQCARVLMDPRARLAARRARSPPRIPRELRSRIEHGRLAGDGRGHHRPRNGPRAGRRGAVRRAAARARSSCAAASGSSRGSGCCWSRTSSPPACRSREAIEAVAGGRRRGRSPPPLWSTARAAPPISACPSSRSSGSTSRPTRTTTLPAELAALPRRKAGEPEGGVTRAPPPRRQHRPCRDDPERARRRPSRSGPRRLRRRRRRRRRHHRPSARGPAPYHRRGYRRADGAA